MSKRTTRKAVAPVAPVAPVEDPIVVEDDDKSIADQDHSIDATSTIFLGPVWTGPGTLYVDSITATDPVTLLPITLFSSANGVQCRASSIIVAGHQQ